jgi:hypothetical protein
MAARHLSAFEHLVANSSGYLIGNWTRVLFRSGAQLRQKLS